MSTNTAGYLATNAFLTQIKWNGTNAAIGYSQIFGGYGIDQANGVAFNAAGNVFIVGSATSTNISYTPNNLIGSLAPINASYAGYSDAFVTVFKSDFSSLLYSAYLGVRTMIMAMALRLIRRITPTLSGRPSRLISRPSTRGKRRWTEMETITNRFWQKSF